MRTIKLSDGLLIVDARAYHEHEEYMLALDVALSGISSVRYDGQFGAMPPAVGLAVVRYLDNREAAVVLSGWEMSARVGDLSVPRFIKERGSRDTYEDGTIEGAIVVAANGSKLFYWDPASPSWKGRPPCDRYVGGGCYNFGVHFAPAAAKWLAQAQAAAVGGLDTLTGFEAGSVQSVNDVVRAALRYSNAVAALVGFPPHLWQGDLTAVIRDRLVAGSGHAILDVLEDGLPLAIEDAGKRDLVARYSKHFLAVCGQALLETLEVGGDALEARAQALLEGWGELLDMRYVTEAYPAGAWATDRRVRR